MGLAEHNIFLGMMEKTKNDVEYSRPETHVINISTSRHILAGSNPLENPNHEDGEW